MELKALASGSKGNCTCIRGESGSLLIDVGLSRKETLHRLTAAGEDPSMIEAILVTHEHSDHIRGVDVLARHLNVPVYATAGTAEALVKKCGRATPEIRRCRYKELFSVGDFSIEPFATSHDAQEPCGFCIAEGDLRIGLCSDTGAITSTIFDHLATCDGILLESNHCPQMLEDGPYPPFLKKRIRSDLGHLSNTDAARCLKGLAGNIHKAILAHLSEINNTETSALSSAREGLGLYFDPDLLSVAEQDPGPEKTGYCGFRI